MLADHRYCYPLTIMRAGQSHHLSFRLSRATPKVICPGFVGTQLVG
jgi:hypothetical protein